MERKVTSFFYFVLSSVFVFSSCFAAVDSSLAGGEKKHEAGRVADEIIIKFKGDKKINVIKIAESGDFDEILDSYKKNPNIEYAEPNYTYQMSIVPSDAYFNYQWYLEKVKAPEAWDLVHDSPKITIAVLDSGVQTDHPDLADNIWTNPKETPGDNVDNDNNGYIDDVHGWDFVNNVPDPSPKFKEGFTEAGVEHGTIVSGIIAASGNNDIGIAGVTWKAQIMPLKVLDDKGEGNTTNVVKGIDYAIANGANIINFSFVGFGYSKTLDDEIKKAYDAGVVIVAAAGNEQSNGSGYLLDDTPMYPVCYDGLSGENRVIGVAATDSLDQKAPFSSYGYSCVDVAAPGIGVFSTVPYAPTVHFGNRSFNKYYDGYWSGTSMATPIVAGVIALVEAANPALSGKEAADVVLKTADNIDKLNPDFVGQLGRGRLNALAAVENAKESLSSKVTKIISSPFSGGKSLIKTTDENGNLVNKPFYGFGEQLKGGFSAASGFFDDAGLPLIVTVPSSGPSTQVKIFDIAGKPVRQFYPFGKNFRGGANVAVGDVNGDGVDEIVVAAGPGNAPQIKIFNDRGQLFGQFMAYTQSFRGGVSVAVGDVDGNGIGEIVTGPGRGGGPQVRIFNMKGKLVGQFFTHDNRYRYGIHVAVGDVNGNANGNRAEIIVTLGQGGEPRVKVFTNKGYLLKQFFAYANVFKGGVNVAAGDINNDGYKEIITGAGPGGSPHVRVFTGSGDLVGSFYAFDSNFAGGVNVSTITGYRDYLYLNNLPAETGTSTLVKFVK